MEIEQRSGGQTKKKGHYGKKNKPGGGERRRVVCTEKSGEKQAQKKNSSVKTNDARANKHGEAEKIRVHQGGWGGEVQRRWGGRAQGVSHEKPSTQIKRGLVKGGRRN